MRATWDANAWVLPGTTMASCRSPPVWVVPAAAAGTCISTIELSQHPALTGSLRAQIFSGKFSGMKNGAW